MRYELGEAPTESYADIGGLEDQIMEMKEAVELPLTHPELYEDVGIKPPKGAPRQQVISTSFYIYRIVYNNRIEYNTI